MIFVLTRKWVGKNATIGTLSLDGSFLGYTLERSDMIIPVGTYALELYDSPKHGPETPQLKDVPGRENIQIHVANYPHELLGCIALGTEKDVDTPAVWHSKEACGKLLPSMREAIKEGKAYIAIS